MIWGPDEWDAFTIDGAADEDLPPPAGADAVVDLLRHLPGRRRMTVADLGCGKGDWLPFLTRHFAHVVAIDYAPATLALARRAHGDDRVVFRRRDLRDLTPFRGAFHVGLLLDALVGPKVEDVDRVLAQVHGCLVEGGLLVATVPAASRRGGPVPMRLAGHGEGPPVPRFNEMDVQYRLRRAGFLGIRILRIVGKPGRPDALVAVAAKRANN